MATTYPGMKLDLGCGAKVRPGFLGIDLYAWPCINRERADLLQFPWPWPDRSVDEVWCSHFFEHVPGRLRGQWMDELWRILIPGGIATITVPEWDSPGAVQDFTHEWPPVCEQSFLYFNRDARRLMGLEHYPVRCHFDYQVRHFVEFIPQMEVRMWRRS